MPRASRYASRRAVRFIRRCSARGAVLRSLSEGWNGFLRSNMALLVLGVMAFHHDSFKGSADQVVCILDCLAGSGRVSIALSVM